MASVLPADGKTAPAVLKPFRLRAEPVNNAEFLAFVKTHPAWRRDRVPPVFADGRYLSQWIGPDQLGPDALPRQPVTQVSWFAAQAFYTHYPFTLFQPFLVNPVNGVFTIVNKLIVFPLRVRGGRV